MERLIEKPYLVRWYCVICAEEFTSNELGTPGPEDRHWEDHVTRGDNKGRKGIVMLVDRIVS